MIKRIDFTYEMALAIHSCAKKQTRRPIKCERTQQPKYNVGDILVVSVPTKSPPMERIFLCVKDRRTERLHDISIADIEREGFEPIECDGDEYCSLCRKDVCDFSNDILHRARFIETWQDIYRHSDWDWHKNPKVWVYTFETITEEVAFA